MNWNNVFSRLAEGNGNGTADAKRARFQPRPPGVIQPGSATDAILSVLLNTRDRYLPTTELLRRTDRSRVAISLSLIYLKENAFIEAIADDGRNCRYMRYRLSEKGRRYATERPSPTAQLRACGMALCELQSTYTGQVQRFWNLDFPVEGRLSVDHSMTISKPLFEREATQ